MALVDEVLDVQDPADRDGRVAGPGGDPVRPGVREPEPVAEGDPRVRVRPAVGRQPPDSAANSSASASAPTVVSAIDTRVIGPYAASEVGRLKMPTPMMLPTISAIAAVRPN